MGSPIEREHAPGQWYAVRTVHSLPSYDGPETWEVRVVLDDGAGKYGGHRILGDELTEAQARTIALAPELAAELRRVREYGVLDEQAESVLARLPKPPV